MNVTYSDSAKQGKGYRLLQEATAQLEDILGRSAAGANAEWDRTEDGTGRPRYTLHLRHKAESVAGSFSEDDLASARDLRYELRSLWSDLLRHRSHKHLERLLKMDEPGS